MSDVRPLDAETRDPAVDQIMSMMYEAGHPGLMKALVADQHATITSLTAELARLREAASDPNVVAVLRMVMDQFHAAPATSAPFLVRPGSGWSVAAPAVARLLAAIEAKGGGRG